MSISLKEFGRMIERVENLVENLEKNAKDTKSEIEKIHTRIDDHMLKEEAEREEMIKMAKEDRKEILSIMKENAQASQARHEAAQKETAERFKLLEEGYQAARLEKSLKEKYWVGFVTAMIMLAPFIWKLIGVVLSLLFPDLIKAHPFVADLFASAYSAINIL